MDSPRPLRSVFLSLRSGAATHCNRSTAGPVSPWSAATAHFSLTTHKFRFPSTGLTRTYYDCCLGPTPGELLAGTSVGELVVFNAEHLLYRAALPIVTGGLLSLACAGSFVFVGAGDGKCKKLQGNDQYWSVVGETQVATPTVSSCSPTWTIADQPFPNSNSG